MSDWKRALLEVGKVSGAVLLNSLLPGAGGLIQLAENLHGSKTGMEKKAVVRDMALVALSSLAKSGKLEGAAPVVAEVEGMIQEVFDAMKKAGALEEAGTLSVGGKRYSITVNGVLP